MTNLQRLTAITGEINSLYHEAALRLGQSDSAMAVLYALLEDGKCNISDICKLCGVRKQTLNSALRKLEAEGLIRLESAGGKSKAALLTERGQDAARKSAGRLKAIEDSVLSDWSEEEIHAYLALSKRYLDSFRALVMELPDKNQDASTSRHKKEESSK